MNKKELIESISHLPSDCSGPRPMIDKLTTLELIKLLDEPKKVTVPQFVAEWIDYCKENHLTLTGAFEPVSEHGVGLAETFKGNAYKCTRWALDNQNLFARAWLDGYEAEEKRYTVKIKAVDQYLVNATDENFLGFLQSRLRTKFTRKELEEYGFDWVFDCPGVEVEEVEG